ncbi:MAG: hypothetical protein H6544_01515 [Prevotellaceae bacterium]|nr:hypothetical protein [Prevotellaceae bacterium]
MFSVIITEHRLWGHVFQPYILEKKEKEHLYSVVEIVTVKNRDLMDSLSEKERMVVGLCDKYSESNVLKIFVKEKLTIAEFIKRYEKCPKDYEHVLPYIDKYNYKVAQYLMSADIPVFVRNGGFMNVYDADRLVVPATYTKAVSSFELTTDALYYSLKVYQDGKNLSLRNLTKNKTVVLSNSPCCTVVKNRLCVFENLDSSKLTPFFQKEHVVVPTKTIPVYMRSFVKNTLKVENVEASGFSVLYDKPEMKPVLVLMEDLSRKVALQLRFRYGENEFSGEVINKRSVTLDEQNGDFVFHIFERDEERESYYADVLSSLGLRLINMFYYLKKNEVVDLYGVVDFLIENKGKLSDFEIKQEQGEQVFFLEPISCSLSVDEQNKDWFDVFGNVTVGAFSIPFCKFRKNIISGIREYTLPDGSITLLPEEWFSRYSDLLRFSEEKEDKIRIKKFHFGIMDGISTTISQYRGALESQVPVPKGIEAQLRSYQQTGYSWLVSLYENDFGGCLADDMGLGKTLQFLAFFQYIYKGVDAAPCKKEQHQQQKEIAPVEWPYMSVEPTLFDQLLAPDENRKEEKTSQEEKSKTEEKKVPASLVVLPTSLLFNWEREKQRFAPMLRSLVYSGSKRVRSKDIGRIFSHYDVVFTTYGVLRNDLDFIRDYPFECVVLDESQYIKNPSSQAYHSVMELKAKHYFVISGTPIENSLNDLWAQMNFVNRGILSTLSYFKNYFVAPIVKQQNEDKKSRLQQIIKPFILRRTKSEVAKDLPPMIEQVVLCEMTEEHRKLYLKEKSVARNTVFDHIMDGMEKNSMLAISALLRLRQLSNHPALVTDTYQGESSKLEEVLSRIESLRSEGHKVLIFSSFVKHLELVEARLVEMGLKYSKLIGTTQNREEVISDFQKKEEVGCFLISLKAGGVGLNLTAADYVFILDPWWNPAAESQAVNRAHRIGQDKTIMVYRFIMADTIEDKIQNLQAEKSRLAQTFINNNNPFMNMSAADFEKLFS